MGQNTKIGFQLGISDTGTAAFGGTPQWAGEMALAVELSDGILAGMANLNYLAERTVASATNDDIDLASVLESALGESFVGAKLVALVIINAPKLSTATQNTTNLTIGVGSNPFLGFLGGTTPTIGPIKPGGFLILGASHLDGIGAIVAGTGDILRVANSSGASATYQIALIARAAS